MTDLASFLKFPGYTIGSQYQIGTVSGSTPAAMATAANQTHYVLAFTSDGKAYAFVPDITLFTPSSGVDLYVRRPPNTTQDTFVPCSQYHIPKDPGGGNGPSPQGGSFWPDIVPVPYPPAFKIKLLPGETMQANGDAVLRRNLDGAWILIRLGSANGGSGKGFFYPGSNLRSVWGYAAATEILSSQPNFGATDVIFDGLYSGIDTSGPNVYNPGTEAQARSVSVAVRVNYVDATSTRVTLTAAVPAYGSGYNITATQLQPLGREYQQFGTYAPPPNTTYYNENAKYFRIQANTNGDDVSLFNILGDTSQFENQTQLLGANVYLYPSLTLPNNGGTLQPRNQWPMNALGTADDPGDHTPAVTITTHWNEIIVQSPLQRIIDYITTPPPGLQSGAGLGAIQCCANSQSDPVVYQQCSTAGYANGAGACANVSLGTYCQGDNLRTDACQTYCKSSGVYCDQYIIAWNNTPNSGTGTGTTKLQSDPNIVGCFQSTNFYDTFYNNLYNVLPGLGEMPREPECTFTPCSNPNAIKPQQWKEQNTTCPPITSCVQQVNVNNQGQIQGNVTLAQTAQCQSLTSAAGATNTNSTGVVPTSTGGGAPNGGGGAGGSGSTTAIVVGVIGGVALIALVVYLISRSRRNRPA